MNKNGTEIIFENGFGEYFHLLKVIDEDRDGIWQDSDGDHVADTCDKYPNDPDRGYFKDESETLSMNIIISLIIGITIIVVISKKHTDDRNVK